MSDTAQPKTLTCRRQGCDRRQVNWRSLAYALLMSRRRDRRRQGESQASYVDYYSPVLLTGVLLLLLLCVLDSYFTLLLIEHGSRELNPFLDWLLAIDVGLFYAVKYCITACSVILIVVHERFSVFGIKGYHVLVAALLGYFVLINYQLSMLLPIYI